ncbi:MAG: MMPL family transporter [Polyangiaceae bacterium]|nr:MMPL family transporter [Polyangiaceae bacterium]
MNLSVLQRPIAWIAAKQTQYPWVFLIVALITVLPTFFAVRSLTIRDSFEELLPSNKPSVIELEKTNQRLASASTLTVVAESKNVDLLKRFVDELTPKLRKLPSEFVASVDPGPGDAQRFFEDNKHLYASLKDVRELHDEVVEAYDREVGKVTGTNPLLDDAADAKDNKVFDEKELEKRLNDAVAEIRSRTPGMDGYYIGTDKHGTLAAIFVRTTLKSMDTRAHDLQKMVDDLVLEGDYKTVDPEFKHNYTGNLITSVEQYDVIVDDLVTVGVAGVSLVLLVVFLFFLRFRCLISLGLSILLGVGWSLAFASLSIGYLNIATGFLVSIIAGNGINAMIIWMARYLEARRDQQEDVRQAIHTASVDTCEPTLAVVFVNIISYGALMITDFRGFRHFGIIGGMGIFLCWISCFFVLPAVFVLIERIRPLPEQHTWRDSLAGAYGKPFAWIVKAAPKPIAIVGILLGAIGVTASVLYIVQDPMEYDLYNVLNDEKTPTSAGWLSSRVNDVAGRLNQGGRAVVVDKIDQVHPLVAELERRREAAPADSKPFDQVVSIFSLLPDHQEEKIELLKDALSYLERARSKGFISDDRYAKISEHLPKELKALTIENLPELVSRQFREKDGTLGTIVYVSPTKGRSINDVHYLMEWANSFREVELPDGAIIHGTGQAVVFSDMLINIAEDSPKVAAFSLGGTLLVILFAFRFRKAGWSAMATLLLGVSWMIGFLFFANIKINFLNFVAIPVAIGAGADYAINVMKRREIEGPEGIEKVFVETGGAVIACSCATLVGYTALLLSINGAVRSFGIVAASGEIATQWSAMLVLPAILYWMAAAQAKRAQKSCPCSQPSDTNSRDTDQVST